VLPLIFTEGIDLYKLDTTVLLAPPPPAAPPPRAEAVAPKQSFMHAQLTAPTVVPKHIATSAPESAAPAPALAGMAGGVTGGIGDVLGGSAAGPAPPPPAAAPPKKDNSLRIFSGVKEPALLYAPPVVYSPVAKQLHISGVVIVEAIIDDKGDVTEVKAISGPPLLLSSALKAVAGRRYAPTILDGQPVAIRLNVKVDFHLG
jgi:outer membrane biosynthesis protein TonB